MESRKLTVASVVSAYLRHLERQNRAGAFATDGLLNIRRDLTRFAEFVGSKLVRNCKQHDLSSWLEANEQWKSVCTRKNVVASVLGAFKWAWEEELIDRCPYRRPRSLKGMPSPTRRPASIAEYKALIRGGTKPLRRVLFFLWHTGARTCEARELKWTDVVFGHQSHIVLTKHKTARKTGRSRIIALNPVVAKFLLWLKKQSKSEFVFVNTDGTQWERRVFSRHFRRVADRIGVRGGVSAYCLRHSFACDALIAGMTSKQVADQLGHADTAMVDRVYGSYTAKDMSYLNRVADDIRQRRA